MKDVNSKDVPVVQFSFRGARACGRGWKRGSTMRCGAARACAREGGGMGEGSGLKVGG